MSVVLQIMLRSGRTASPMSVPEAFKSNMQSELSDQTSVAKQANATSRRQSLSRRKNNRLGSPRGASLAIANASSSNVSSAIFCASMMVTGGERSLGSEAPPPSDATVGSEL